MAADAALNGHAAPGPSRRALLGAAAGAAALVLVRPAAAGTPALQAAIDTFAQGAPVADAGGRVQIEIAELVENGNVVPVRVRVASPMTPAEHVRAIALFTARNPRPEVAVFQLGPASGRAEVATRMRLATSQTVAAGAQLHDGRCWRTTVDVVVTLAACIEG